MKNILIFCFIGAVIIGTAVYLAERKPTESSPVSTEEVETVQPQTEEQFITSNPDNSTLRAGGSSYSDAQGLYTILYPNDYILDDQDPIHPRIYKRGETQRPQSEMSDGVLMVFETIDLQDQSLEAVVDSRIQMLTADGTSEITQPKKATTLNGYAGFTYSTRGLGESSVLVLQKDPQSTQAVSITFLVADPQQLGYQSEVDAILSTVELMK